MRWIILLLGILIIACTPTGNTTNDEVQDTDVPEQAEDPVVEQEPEEASAISWRTAELIDVSTSDTFTIEELEKPVVLESFAVWCPTCLKQQQEMAKVEAIHVSLDTDPNEDEQMVAEHASQHGFKWRFAVSPKPVTESLIEEFGFGIVSAPSSPVVVICPDGATQMLGKGLKTAEEIQAEIEAC